MSLFLSCSKFNGIGILGNSQGGGVAYGAHIGGFIAGLFLIKFFAVGRK